MVPIAQVLSVAAFVCPAPVDAPTSATVAFAAEIGITPESLVVAGFSSTDAQSVVDNLGTNSEYQTTLANAHSLVETKAAALATAESALAASPTNETLIAARNTARSQMASASAALKAVPAAIRAAVVSNYSEGKRTILAAYAEGAGRMTPHEFKAILRTEAEWTALEGALRAEARATRRGETLAEGQASLLSSARSNETVSAAKSRLDNTLASVKAVFTPSS